MAHISPSKATRRDIETIKQASRDLWQDIQSPLFWLGLAVIAFFIAAPWLLSIEELKW